MQKFKNKPFNFQEGEDHITPGTPVALFIHSTRIELQWENIEELSSECVYQIQYKNIPDGQWVIYESTVSHDSSRTVVNGLKPCTPYCFRIRAVNVSKGKKYPFSSKSKIFETISPKLQMKYCSNLAKSANSEIYRLPTKEIPEARNKKIKFKKFSLGKDCAIKFGNVPWYFKHINYACFRREWQIVYAAQNNHVGWSNRKW